MYAEKFTKMFIKLLPLLLIYLRKFVQSSIVALKYRFHFAYKIIVAHKRIIAELAFSRLYTICATVHVS